MICNNCGKHFQNADRFCPFCGAMINQSAASDKRSESMNAVRKKQRNKTIECLIVLLVTLAALLIGIVLLADDEEAGGVFVLVGIVLLYFWPLHYMCFRTLRNVRWLEKRGKADIGSDIVITPGQRLCCGQNAFFETKQCLLVPYEDVIWVYEHRIVWFVFVISRRLMVFTKDGKLFQLKVKTDEFSRMYEHTAQRFPKGLMLGASQENRKKYKEIRRRQKSGTAAD